MELQFGIKTLDQKINSRKLEQVIRIVESSSKNCLLEIRLGDLFFSLVFIDLTWERSVFAEFEFINKKYDHEKHVWAMQLK